jgi:hypothetical protein
MYVCMYLNSKYKKHQQQLAFGPGTYREIWGRAADLGSGRVGAEVGREGCGVCRGPPFLAVGLGR